MLEDTDMNNYFLSRTPIAQEMRPTIEKWDYIKLIHFCTLKETAESRDNPKNGRKSSLAIQQIFRIYKELKNLNSKRII
jgi:hypothetical protein